MLLSVTLVAAVIGNVVIVSAGVRSGHVRVGVVARYVCPGGDGVDLAGGVIFGIILVIVFAVIFVILFDVVIVGLGCVIGTSDCCTTSVNADSFIAGSPLFAFSQIVLDVFVIGIVKSILGVVTGLVVIERVADIVGCCIISGLVVQGTGSGCDGCGINFVCSDSGIAVDIGRT